MAEPLISRNNPVAMYFKAGILMNGLAGKRDLSQARALLRDAAQRGDPTSLLFMARFLEKGIGGPQDLDTAKRLYILAAQGMANGADRDVARLGLSGDVGLTALQAYQTLSGGTRRRKRCTTPARRFGIWRIRALRRRYVCRRNCSRWPKHEGGTSPNSARAPRSGVPRARRCDLTAFNTAHRAAIPGANGEWENSPRPGGQDYPKNLVEADVFYRLTMLNKRLGADAKQVKQQLAAVEGQMTPEEKAQANGLFHSAIPASMAP